jgi:uncharacterized membrane protein YbhN (UPF0104 family)
MDLASDVVIFGRIWRAQPIFGVLLQLVSYNLRKRRWQTMGASIGYERLILFISLAICCIVSITVVSSSNTDLRTRYKRTQSLSDAVC